MKKTNYFYIDETGHVNNNSKLFIYGCIKTDTPSQIQSVLEDLRTNLQEDILNETEIENILKHGFHATEDHFDTRTSYYRLLPFLNVRAYFVVLIKQSQYFLDLKRRLKDFEIIELMLRKLIIPRITKNANDKNIFIVENLLVQGKSLKAILESIINPLKLKFDVHFEIKGKDELNLSTIDYLNFNLNHVLMPEKFPLPSFVKTFNILKDKIALINILNDNSYFSRIGDENHKIEIINLRKILAED